MAQSTLVRETEGMTPRELSQLIKAIIRAEEMPALYIWGGPGIGKSRICHDEAKSAEIGFIDMRLSMKDPTDLKGIPSPHNGKSLWLPPSDLPTEGRGLLLLDEVNLAPPLVQASAYQLVLDRKVGEYVLPKGWKIIAAGNKSEHGANVFKMAAPLRNRFTHVELKVDHDSWLEWALKNSIASEVIEFINYRPDKLYAFDPQRHENAFPTPRSWEFVSQIKKNSPGLSPEILSMVIDGTVGNGASLEFKSYTEMKSKMPSIEKILAGEDQLVDNVSIACALVTALAVRARPDQFERLLQYSQAMGKKYTEVSALMIRMMIMRDKTALIRCPSWPKLSKEYYDLMDWK